MLILDVVMELDLHQLGAEVYRTLNVELHRKGTTIRLLTRSVSQPPDWTTCELF